MTFRWDLDKEYKTGGGNVLHVLRRMIHDYKEYEEDIYPFREIPALWRFVRNGSVPLRIIGTMSSLEVKGTSEIYTIVAQDGSRHVHVVPCTPLRSLTVWRVNDSLDMLQLVVEHPECQVYAQLGGSRTLPILLDREDDVLTSALTLFWSNEPKEVS